MKRVNDTFLRQAIAQTNFPINLVAIEVSETYLSSITPFGEYRNFFTINDELVAKFISGEVSFTSNLSSGEVWVASIERGNNIGARKIISSVSGEWVTLADSVDFVFSPKNTDVVRISKYLLLAMTNQDVQFYIPDASNGADVEATYKAFPFSINPVGTSIDGEIMSMTVDVSNVNRLVGDSVQNADGLRGSRIIHMLTFDTCLGSGRENCLMESMYVDSVTITNQVMAFKLESRFNIMALQIPLATYNRNFCRFFFRTPECAWQPTVSGEVNLDLVNFPFAKTYSCDHSLMGPNGCEAHKNTVRFGAFPSISN